MWSDPVFQRLSPLLGGAWPGQSVEGGTLGLQGRQGELGAGLGVARGQRAVWGSAPPGAPAVAEMGGAVEGKGDGYLVSTEPSRPGPTWASICHQVFVKRMETEDKNLVMWLLQSEHPPA